MTIWLFIEPSCNRKALTVQNERQVIDQAKRIERKRPRAKSWKAGAEQMVIVLILWFPMLSTDIQVFAGMNMVAPA